MTVQWSIPIWQVRETNAMKRPRARTGWGLFPCCTFIERRSVGAPELFTLCSRSHILSIGKSAEASSCRMGVTGCAGSGKENTYAKSNQNASFLNHMRDASIRVSLPACNRFERTVQEMYCAMNVGEKHPSGGRARRSNFPRCLMPA